MKKAITLSFFLFVNLVMLRVQAQDKLKLEKEREELRKEMRALQEASDHLKGEKKQALGQLSLVSRKMALQDQYITTINKQLRAVDDGIYIGALEIIKLQRQLDTLKQQYSRSIIYAYKNRSSFDYLNFIFSAGSFNYALKRVRYLKSYRAYREQQVLNIVQTKKMIEDKKRDQLIAKSEKSNALKDQSKQLELLAEQKKEKDKVVKEIRSQEKDYKKKLAEKRKKDSQIKNAIVAIVRRAQAEAAAEAKAKRKEEVATAAAAKKAATLSSAAKRNTNSKANNSITGSLPRRIDNELAPVKNYLNYSVADIELNNSFEKNKGKLSWPVDKGNVIMVFGTNKLDNDIDFDSPGITISTPSAGLPVKSVFKGEVAAIVNLGDFIMVTIRHGKYFTVYSNLASVNVNKNDKISTGQVIGRCANADDGDGGSIDLLLMIERNNVNPQSWLRN